MRRSLFFSLPGWILLYRGFKQNQALLSEREDFKRYLLFRGDKEVRLKIYGEDETVYENFSKIFRAAEELQENL